MLAWAQPRSHRQDGHGQSLAGSTAALAEGFGTAPLCCWDAGRAAGAACGEGRLCSGVSLFLVQQFGATPINTELSVPALVSERSLIAHLFASLLHMPSGSSAVATRPAGQGTHG